MSRQNANKYAKMGELQKSASLNQKKTGTLLSSQSTPKLYDQMMQKHMYSKMFTGGTLNLKKVRNVSSDVIQKIQEFKKNPSSFDSSQGR